MSPASLPGMYERTISVYTFSKSYAMTGLRLGYLAARDPKLRERMKKALFYTASNVASVVQYGGIGALEGLAGLHRGFPRRSFRRGAISSTRASRTRRGGVLQRRAAEGRVLCVPADRSGVDAAPQPTRRASISWAMAEHLISRGRIGCVPGADFGANGEGYIRFCFARERRELDGRAGVDAAGCWQSIRFGRERLSASTAASSGALDCRARRASANMAAAVDADGLPGHEVRLEQKAPP